MTECPEPDPPSAFVVDWAHRMLNQLPAAPRALDVAMGRGRHATTLAKLGYRVFGVDARFEAVASAMASARSEGIAVRGWCADLTVFPLPLARFDLIVVARYLQRDLFHALGASLAPGGVVIYETFTEAQRATGRGPRSPDHLLAPGELRTAFPLCDVVFYEEACERDCVARLVAARTVNSRSYSSTGSDVLPG
jgi:SAM-dependent methyltransferase